MERGFAEARVETVLEPTPLRVEAPCRHFGTCGGCRFQDLAYEAQLAAKEQQVRDALLRIGKIVDPPLEPIMPAASLYGYRNKLEYSFTSSEAGVDLGFHRAGRWDEVIGIEECLLTTGVGNAIRAAVRDWAREERLEPYEKATGEGYLRHLVVREGRNTGQALVVLVTAPGERFGYLAGRGCRVNAVDVDAACRSLTGVAGVEFHCVDLEGGRWPFAGALFDGIVVVHYLHRPLLPLLAAALAPQGLLIYETFAQGNERYGRPRSPDFLLRPRELLDVFGGLRVLAFDDGRVATTPPAMVQRIAAVRLEPRATEPVELLAL